MSLEFYIEKFKGLNVARRDEHASPHKVCMLLAVMDLMEREDIVENRIEFNNQLVEKFEHHFNLMRINRDQSTPYLPFYHLKNDGFWHHKVISDQESIYESLSHSNSKSRLKQCIAYAYLDDELFDYFNSYDPREKLKQALFENIDSFGREDLRGAIGGWDRKECELIVSDYLEMLTQEMKGERYSKTDRRRALLPLLNGRSEGSIEYKHQNISAVMLELGYPYILGYKPAFNYQRLLKDVVISQMEGKVLSLQESADVLIAEVPEKLTEVNWESVIDTAPELIPYTERNRIREYQPLKFNYTERESKNRKLGERGEKFVIECEKDRLNRLGRPDLAEEIEWTSHEKGDGAGYDIRSFKGREDIELFIEVKTTNSGKYQPFMISDNEVAFSAEHPENYSLYRVFDFKRQGRLFTLPGNINDHVYLFAKQYQASFK